MASSSPGSSDRPLRVAVIGAGPAGFYAADALLKHKSIVVEVDLFDRLPTPYGLVRFGVAPDHQKIKSVTKAYAKIAEHERFRFLGNVAVCLGQLSIEELLSHYDQIVFAVGCETDRRLGIAGEDLVGSHAATSFVAWYNGHPDFIEYPVALDAERAAIVGVGDVAMDITRMLVRGVEDLEKTDIADYALDVFRKNRVREVYVVARRGPAQAAFATKELDDIVQLPGVAVHVDATLVRQALADAARLDGLTRRKVDFLAALAERPKMQDAQKHVYLRFCASPVEIEERDGQVAGLKVERTELVPRPDGSVQARGTGQYETLPVGLVFRSVGYRGVPLEGIPFDEGVGIIPNADGRVLRDGKPWPGVYVTGWIKRGPSGVIGTNKSDATATVERMVEDVADLARTPLPSREEIDSLLEKRGVRVVTFANWLKIDEEETLAGGRLGRVRQKITSVERMLELIS